VIPNFAKKFTNLAQKQGIFAPLFRRNHLMAVTVYTLPSCVQCDSTKRMLKSIDVDYEEVDMSQDPVALEMVKTLGYTAAPVVVSGDDHWSGFRMEKIQALSA
jgi:glutaredoxin-like protein NrdH